MNLLVTGALKVSNDLIKQIEGIGYNVFFMQSERDNLPLGYEEVNCVICNGLFLYHPIEKFVNLKFIQLTSAGFDRVPMDYINEKGIRIFNARGVYSIPMAEFAICGVLSLYKKMQFFNKNQTKHLWEKNREIQELFGKTVCIIGCGNIGNECVRRFNAFGCHIIGVDIAERTDNKYAKIYPIKELSNALKQADIVVLTLPLTDDTRHIINAEAFSEMKEGTILVNISRGAVVDTRSLITALDTKLSGAVLDVFEEEPLDTYSPLWDKPNVIITPHNSYVGEGNSLRLNSVILKNLENMI